MAKIYIEDIKLTAIRNKIFGSLSKKEQLNIFDIITLSSGDYLPTQKMIEGKYVVYGGGGITDKKHNDFNVGYETLGIGRVGARCGCVFKIKSQSWVTDNALYANKIDKQFDLEFLIHFFNFKNFNQYANTAAQPVISLKRISGVSIPKIDLHLQKEIVFILNNVESGIIEIENDKYGIRQTLNYVNSSEILDTELSLQLSLLKSLRQQLLQDAIQGKLVPQDETEGNAQELLAQIKAEKAQLIKDKKLKKEKDLPPITAAEIPFDIPDNWVWCRLGEITQLISGQDFEPTEYSCVNNGGIPYITGASNIEGNQIILNRWTKTAKSVAYAGDLILTCKGSGVGKNAILAHEKVHIARQLMAIRSQNILIKYLQIIVILQIDVYRGKAKSQIPGIDRDIVLNTFIPLPPLSEQNRIVQKLESLMQTCDALTASIKQSTSENEQLLQQVLREALQTR